MSISPEGSVSFSFSASFYKILSFGKGLYAVRKQENNLTFGIYYDTGLAVSRNAM